MMHAAAAAPVALGSWSLAINVHGSDGHNFGYGASAWSDDSNLGDAATAFSGDYKASTVMDQTANYVAIARHQNGQCEAVKVWELETAGQTLKYYLDHRNTERYTATNDHHIYKWVSPDLVELSKDPIFAVDGDLVFNWWYSNNGVRIANSNTYVHGALPGTGDNSDDYHGLGNEFGADTANAHGSSSWWHDIGQHQGNCHGGSCAIMGTDHGSALNDGTLYGQYAVFTSDIATTFPCEGQSLHTAMQAR
jgi:hypothetical protein